MANPERLSLPRITPRFDEIPDPGQRVPAVLQACDQTEPAQMGLAVEADPSGHPHAQDEALAEHEDRIVDAALIDHAPDLTGPPLVEVPGE